jgi:hypothetical protein
MRRPQNGKSPKEAPEERRAYPRVLLSSMLVRIFPFFYRGIHDYMGLDNCGGRG